MNWRDALFKGNAFSAYTGDFFDLTILLAPPTLPDYECSSLWQSLAAIFFSPSLNANTSPEHTVRVRPGLVTFPHAINDSPAAGDTRFILYSTYRTRKSLTCLNH
jgi:hypothetical protein